MNAIELAEKLNGCNYRDEITKELELEAKNNGLVVVFVDSDDLMHLRGSIDAEVGAWEGGSVLVAKNEKAKEITAIWCPDEIKDKEGNLIDYVSWEIETEIKHYTFDVFEDGQLYCRGIVFSLSDCKY